MEVTVDKNYQISLPEDVRDKFEIEVGQRFKVIISGKEITLVPIYPGHGLRGMLKGMDIEGYREDEDMITVNGVFNEQINRR